MSELKVPSFQSAVPEVLRHPMTESERSVWVADQLSIQSQQLYWVCERLVETNRLAQENAKTIKTWRERIISPAAVGLAFIAWAGPLVITLFFK